MSLSNLGNELRNLLDLLVAKEIALLINPPQERGPLRNQRLSWPQIADSNLFRQKSPTVDEYCRWIEARAYSALLFDGSLLQVTYDLDAGNVVGHRLVYFPCPFDIDEVRLREEPILDVISDYKASVEAVRLRSPIRFDFDPANHTSGHPRTHLTVLWDHCRWAVSTPLSLGHFVRFIFRHFYPELWRSHEFLRKWSQSYVAKGALSDDEAAHLHIAWRGSLGLQG